MNWNQMQQTKNSFTPVSPLILDVKVWDHDQDLDALAKKIFEIEIDGAIWKEYKLLDVAYGMKKIRISLIIQDDLVSIDDVIELIEAMEEEVQNVDVCYIHRGL